MSQIHEVKCELCNERAEVRVDPTDLSVAATVPRDWSVKVASAYPIEDSPSDGLIIDYFCAIHSNRTNRCGT
jgi:hypothetical protein